MLTPAIKTNDTPHNAHMIGTSPIAFSPYKIFLAARIVRIRKSIAAASPANLTFVIIGVDSSAFG